MSVRPSVKRVDYDKTKEKSVQIFIPYVGSRKACLSYQSRALDLANFLFLCDH